MKQPKKPVWDLKEVFKEVDRSNLRFNTYSKEQRKFFAKVVRNIRSVV
jgi:hypothetical protein